MHSVRESYSMKWQIRGEVEMDYHRPDEKPLGGKIQCVCSSSSPFSLSSSSSSLKCPHLRTQGVNKEMSEAHPCLVYILCLGYPQTDRGDRQRPGSLGAGRGSFNQGDGQGSNSGCLSSRPGSMAYDFGRVTKTSVCAYLCPLL